MAKIPRLTEIFKIKEAAIPVTRHRPVAKGTPGAVWDPDNKIWFTSYDSFDPDPAAADAPPPAKKPQRDDNIASTVYHKKEEPHPGGVLYGSEAERDAAIAASDARMKVINDRESERNATQRRIQAQNDKRRAEKRAEEEEKKKRGW